MGATAISEGGLGRRVAAFGTVKTVAEWETDRRAAVYAELMLRRLEEGMSPEQAISTPTAALERGPTRHLAWGERKTLRDWADDPRCRTSYKNLKTRIDAGWTVEAALETPTGAVSNAFLVTAWDETKSLSAWGRDARTAVSAGLIKDRVEEGWTPEAAISTPAKAFREGDIEAWGETKGLAEWLLDERCEANRAMVNDRLRRGQTPEEAIGTPPKTGPRLVEAWGETKRMVAWERDPRCLVDHATLDRRLKRGMTPEEAMGTPPTLQDRDGLTAFGEWRTLARWSRDSRCEVGQGTIRKRLDDGLSPEEAITRGNRHAAALARAKEGERRKGMSKPGFARFVTAFGETKTLREWTLDPRCPISHHCLGKRLDEGMTPEAAMARVERRGRPLAIVAWGETKSIAEWAKDPRAAMGEETIAGRLRKGMTPEAAISKGRRPNAVGTPREAFGERRTLREWAADPRCAVTHGVLSGRLQEGMTLEEALTTKPGGNRKLKKDEVGTAFGETKTLREWWEDPRCPVGQAVFLHRLWKGWSLEEAMGTPNGAMLHRPEKGNFVTAWGETKNIARWAEDPRCRVSRYTLAGRLARGMEPELAIVTPSATEDEGVRRSMSGARAHEAFGERKTAAGWAADPRCPVACTTLNQRLRRGMTVEEAIARPAPEQSRGGLTAFGEWKTFSGWARDPRCGVGTGSAIRGRVARGMPPEEAVAGTSRFAARSEEADVRPKGLPSHTRAVTAWGETKSLRGWTRDPRCTAGSHGVLRKRLEEGMPSEEAISRPLETPRVEATLFGEKKTVGAWARDERIEVTATCAYSRIRTGMSPEEALTLPPTTNGKEAVHEAFGEARTIREWMADGRCAAADYDALIARLKRGWTFERALTMGHAGGDRERFAGEVAAFGESKTLVLWAEDARCAVTLHALKGRLRSGESLEEALTRPSQPRFDERTYRAFGAERTLREWAEDRRCVVSHATLRSRMLQHGMSPELAMMTPLGDTRRIEAPKFTAFGRRLTALEWARDPRCVVCADTLRERLRDGWDAEKAMTSPSRRKAA